MLSAIYSFSKSSVRLAGASILMPGPPAAISGMFTLVTVLSGGFLAREGFGVFSRIGVPQPDGAGEPTADNRPAGTLHCQQNNSTSMRHSPKRRRLRRKHTIRAQKHIHPLLTSIAAGRSCRSCRSCTRNMQAALPDAQRCKYTVCHQIELRSRMPQR